MNDCREFTFLSVGSGNTVELGRILGALLKPGSVVALVGDLGAGKTCFIKGLAEGLNGTPADEVTSPTFTILQEYPGRVTLYHFDAYRLSGPDDLESIGFDEYVGGAGVAVIEWADRIGEALPAGAIHIVIQWRSENERRFICSARDAESCAIADLFRGAIEARGAEKS